MTEETPTIAQNTSSPNVGTAQGEDAATRLVASPPPRNCVVIWYHQDDQELINVLEPYLQLLWRRLEPQVTRSYFGYPKYPPLPPTPLSKEDERSDYFKKKYEEAQVEYQDALAKYRSRYNDAVIRLRQRGVLFVPLISNAFLKQFGDDMKPVTSGLRTLMEYPPFQVLPVLLSPTEGVNTSSDPLSAFEPGYHREEACKQIAQLIESTLMAHGYYQPELAPFTPQTALFLSANTVEAVIPPQRERTVDVLMDTLVPFKALVEQASAQVVEARETALLAERTQRTEIEELHKQIAAMQQEAQQRPTGFFAWVRSWLAPRPVKA